MKVAFCTRPDYDKPLGGDAVQLLKTKAYLETDFGVEIIIVTEPEKLDNSFDLIHVFNFAVFQITHAFIEKAVKLAVPVVASSIYWDYSYAVTQHTFQLLGYRGFLSGLKMNGFRLIDRVLVMLVNKPTYISKFFRNELRYFIDKVDVILPNSIEEAKLLLNFAGIDQQTGLAKTRVVHNAVEIKNHAILEESLFFEKYMIPRHFILQVGRMEYVKNQLNLVYALMEDPEIPIVFVGFPQDIQYVERVKAVAKHRGNVYFLSEIDHEDIYSFYYYAKVHALLSLRESPGLVSLEALSQRCPIVVADERFAPVETYFDEDVVRVDPLDKKSIRKGVLEAYNKERLPEKDLSKFSWAYAAGQTMDAYRLVLSKYNDHE